MIFASRGPREIPDPWPYVGPHGSRHAYPGTINGGVPLVHSPRVPHFARQNREPNPLLVAFRLALSKGATIADIYDDMRGYQVSYPGVDDVQGVWDEAMDNGTIDALSAHAFEVLSRLVRLTDSHRRPSLNEGDDMTPTFEFYAEHKEAWITSESVTTRAEADRINAIIGREFYRQVGASA